MSGRWYLCDAVLGWLRHFSRSSLRFQLPLEFIEGTPVRALSDDLLGAALDHPRLLDAQGIKAHGILGIVLAPLGLGNFLHGLEGIVIARYEALVHERLGGPLRLEGAHVGGLQDRPQRPFRRERSTSGSPASIERRRGPEKFRATSISPAAIAFANKASGSPT
jgi:hypothetical protein